MKVKYIEKLRDTSNKIYAYNLIIVEDNSNNNNKGKIICLKASVLKNAILSGDVICTNLALTKDGRLIDKVEKQTYYRYTIWKNKKCIGDLLESIGVVIDFIKGFADEGDYFSTEAYKLAISIELKKIECMLGLKDTKIVYFNSKMREQVLGNINTIANIIKEYGYTIRESKVKRNIQ